MLASRPLCRAGCLGRRAARRHCSSLAVTHLDTWLRDNAASFAPPVMNKLLHRDQLSVMFVGGPNRREDFHLEEGSEFFFQLRGDMELPTLQAGRRELVRIREGEVYLLPSRIPHSPQRPEPADRRRPAKGAWHSLALRRRHSRVCSFVSPLMN